MVKLNYSLKNGGGGNLLNALITDILVGGNRLFHCGDLKIKNNNLFHCKGAVAFGGLCAELIGNCPSTREEGGWEKVHSFC